MLALIGKAESAYKLTSGLVGRNLFLVCLKVTRSNSTPPQMGCWSIARVSPSIKLTDEKYAAPKVSHRLARYQIQWLRQKNEENVNDFLKVLIWRWKMGVHITGEPFEGVAAYTLLHNDQCCTVLAFEIFGRATR